MHLHTRAAEGGEGEVREGGCCERGRSLCPFYGAGILLHTRAARGVRERGERERAERFFCLVHGAGIHLHTRAVRGGERERKSEDVA